MKKRERFEKVAASRVQKILDAMDSLAKCGNKGNYDYSETDVQKMERAIRNKLKDTIARFGSLSAEKQDTGFKF